MNKNKFKQTINEMINSEISSASNEIDSLLTNIKEVVNEYSQTKSVSFINFIKFFLWNMGIFFLLVIFGSYLCQYLMKLGYLGYYSILGTLIFCGFWLALFSIAPSWTFNHLFGERETDELTDFFSRYGYCFFMAGFYLSFIFLCKNINENFPGIYFASNDIKDLITWQIYGLDNILNFILLDAPEIYGLRISDIQHNKDSFLICTFIFCFRTLLSISLISTMLIFYNRNK